MRPIIGLYLKFLAKITIYTALMAILCVINWEIQNYKQETKLHLLRKRDQDKNLSPGLEKSYEYYSELLNF